MATAQTSVHQLLVGRFSSVDHRAHTHTGTPEHLARPTPPSLPHLPLLPSVPFRLFSLCSFIAGHRCTASFTVLLFWWRAASWPSTQYMRRFVVTAHPRLFLLPVCACRSLGSPYLHLFLHRTVMHACIAGIFMSCAVSSRFRLLSTACITVVLCGHHDF